MRYLLFFWGFVLLAAVPVVAAPESGQPVEEQFVLESRAELGAALCLWPEDGLPLALGCANGTNTIRIARHGTFVEGPFRPLATWSAPSAGTNRVWLLLKRKPQGWTLYLADTPVARFAEFCTGAVSVAISAQALPPPEERDTYTQRLAPFRFDDGFMIPEGEKLADNWEQVRGKWSLHTVVDDEAALTIKVTKGGRIPTPARSPNYYSLQGNGANAVILSGEFFHDSCVVRAAVQHNDGTNGIVFLATEAGSFHALTARTDPQSEHVVVELWRGALGAPGVRDVLAAFQTDLTPGQWLQLEATVFDDRIAIAADGIELGRFALVNLPAGGRYGFYCDSAAGTRFDDFSAVSHQDYPFDCAEDVGLQTRVKAGSFKVRAFGGGELLPRAATLSFGAGESTWRFGADDDLPHRLSARFLLPPGGEETTVGLLAGGAAGQPGWLFSCRAAGKTRHYELARLEGASNVVVDSVSLAASGRDLRLALDALRANELRAFADDLQVLFHRTDLPLGGGGAITVNTRAPLSAALPAYTTRAVSYADRFEKNLQYVNDPFMRHWASPEGQWHTDRDGRTWLRGDMIRRVRLRMPVTPNPSTILLATDEDGSNAACRVECANGMLRGFSGLGDDAPLFEIAVTNVPLQQFENNIAFRLFSVGLEDHVFWLGDDTRLLASAHLPQPVAGRRVRISGFDLEQLRFSLVRRENVFDSLFNESLQNWTIGGGRWEVVNRFQCDPTWSHLNGENDDSLAALWSKFDFSGDFCAELYAGMRHGKWYNRVGDLNMTVLSPRGATGQGYTITLTGWDPDNSQNETRLFRNGKVVAATDAYLLPRMREDNVRRGGYEPLVPGGRDVHGAWYGIRLRRTGSRVQLVYDNLPALEYDDPEPLDSGCFGIWTYRNSMMVARVRIVAASVQPRRFAFRALDISAAAAAGVALERDESTLPPQTANGLPLNTLEPGLWLADDPVSQPLVRFSGVGARREMFVSAHHGGGTFFVTNRMPAVAASKLLGWRFEVARSADAAFNLEFSAGNITDKGFVASQWWSYVLSGSEEPRGPRRIAGRADIGATAEGKKPSWTTVYAWLPSAVLSSGLAVSLDGFGNLQPSDIQQGLGGNAPGSWYRIRNFRPVFRGCPILGGIVSQEALAGASAAMAALPPAVLNKFALPAVADPAGNVVEWAIPPDVAFGLKVVQDSVRPDSLLVRGENEWNSPLLPPQSVLVDETYAAFSMEGSVVRVLLPRRLKSRSPTVAVKLADGRTFNQVVALADQSGGAPVLLALDMPEGRLLTFEDRPINANLFSGGAAARVAYVDNVRGSVLRISNDGRDARLAARLSSAYDPLLTPLVQFSYRADPMARFSLYSSRFIIAFTERAGNAATMAGSALTDDDWHVWLGMPLKAVGAVPLSDGLSFPAADLQTGSRHGRDQTGLYSTLLVDDIAFGPAVGPARILAFRAIYDDVDGDLDAVEYGLLSGAQPWALRDAAAQADVKWRQAGNDEVVTPDTASVPEGVNHLVVRARDRAGHISPVADMPFLLDRTPPTVRFALEETPRFNKTALNITIGGGHALPSLRNLSMTCNGKAVRFDGDAGDTTLGEAAIMLQINWPWMLRQQVQKASNGEVLKLSFDGITDIAGNAMPRFEVPITIDIASDKTPPTVALRTMPKNLVSLAPSLSNLTAFFQRIQLDNVSGVTCDDGSAATGFTTAAAGTSLLVSNFRNDPGWQASKNGWFGISMRTMPDDTRAAPRIELRLLPRALPDNARKPADGKHYVITLAAGGSQFVRGAPAWRAGEWQNIMIDVGGFLCAESGLAEAPDIRDMIIAFVDKEVRAYQVRGAAILAPYGDNDVVGFKAYDASGVAGLRWSGGASPHLNIRPSLVARQQGLVWLDVRVADRNGNLSPVFMIPAPPVVLNDKLPAEFAAED